MTLAILGQTLMLVTFAAAVLGAVAAFVGGRQIMRADADRVVGPRAAPTATGSRLADAALRALQVVLISSASSLMLLWLAFAGRDMTLAYVEGRISNDLSLGFRLTALWSGQEGSLLLWLAVLAGAGVLMVRSLRAAAMPAALVAFAAGVVLVVASFFALLVTFIARPFAVVDQLQRDGAGMSPALQNYWMAIHPPTLYLGYVGVAIPFAIVCGALLARRRDDEWIVATRRWVIASWVFLTLGLVLGARWAYEEIGWGGYWAWDPVENAALMPWLTSTALIHSIMVQQRRGMMRFWNALLAMLTFGLSIFGTFLTRSGVLSSVHSFVSSPVGWWFIAALIVVIVCSMTLLYRSRELLQARHDVGAVVSRESMLLFNNLLLVALALVVLWGVVYPIMTASFTADRISLEKPWYDFFAMAFGLPLAALLAFAPFIAWQGTPIARVLRPMMVPLVASLVLGAALIATGNGDTPAAVAATCLGMLVVFGVSADLVRAIRARRVAAPEQPAMGRIVHVLVRNRRRWGAWIAHAGIGLVVVAIAGAAWSTSTNQELNVGDEVRIGGYVLRYDDVERSRSGARMRTRASFAVSRNGREIDVIHAGRDFHPASGEISNEVGIRHDLIRMHDLFVNVDRITEDGEVRVQVIINSLVPLLWIAGLLTALGATIAALPDRRTDRNGAARVEAGVDAVHELRNGAASPRKLLSSVRGAASSPDL